MFTDILENVKDKNVLVIGDSIIDVSIFAEALGISLETPTLKAAEKSSSFSYGGAANVVENILELGSKCTFITLAGSDEYCEVLNKFKHPNLTLVLVNDPSRKNSVKKRYWVSNKGQQYKVLQLNSGSKEQICSAIHQDIITAYNNCIKNKDVVLLVDYRNGMMSEELARTLINIAKINNVMTIASSQVSNNEANHWWYAGSDIICMNEAEAKKNINNFLITDLCTLSKKLNSNICLTLGAEGSAFYEKNKNKTIFKSVPETDEVDPCGAGDCFLAALCVCIGKANIEEILIICNMWASLSVKNVCTKVPDREELVEKLRW